VDLADVERLVEGGESAELELKKSTAELVRAGQTLCGFLNRGGGVVLIGVTPRGRITGQEVSDHTQQEIAYLLSRFEPPAPIDLSVVRLPSAGRSVIALRARSAPDLIPFAFDGRPYQRVGSTTSGMPQERYQQLLLSRLHGRSRWETLAADHVSLSDIDGKEVLRTVRAGISARRMPAGSTDSVGDVLDRLGLRREGNLLNAAVVLFGTEGALRDFPQCVVRLARFRGTGKAEFADSRQVRGHAFLLLEEAVAFLERHLPVAARIVPGQLERVEEPLFPADALREALVNAFCHRDYSVVGGAVHVAVYDDRLEIWSTGTLPPGVELDELKRDHLSRPRNPTIADVFFRRGLVEAWGRGTQRIVELCVTAGRPEPEFLEEGGSFGVRFLPSGYAPPHRVPYDLRARQREILQVLSSVVSSTTEEIRARLANAPPERSFRREMDELHQLGLVRPLGRGRWRRWSLVRSLGEGT
jgi:ATP-dependent DNA helicase RecG